MLNNCGISILWNFYIGTFFKTQGRSLCTDMKGCLPYIVGFKNNKVRTVVYPIVSVFYCCLTNHPKSFSALKQQYLLMILWFGNLSWAQLGQLVSAVCGVGCAHSYIWGLSRGDGDRSLHLAPLSSCSLILKEASPGCSHSGSSPRGWEQKKEIRTLTMLFPPVSIGQSKLQS